jgi:hypothetical protein
VLTMVDPGIWHGLWHEPQPTLVSQMTGAPTGQVRMCLAAMTAMAREPSVRSSVSLLTWLVSPRCQRWVPEAAVGMPYFKASQSVISSAGLGGRRVC